MTTSERDHLIHAIEQSWGKDTSADPENWTPENPAYGQCAVTACILQERLGGELCRQAIDPGRSHYWLKLPSGEEMDLTERQFQGWPYTETGVRREPEVTHPSYEYAAGHPATAKRLAILRARVERELSEPVVGL